MQVSGRVWRLFLFGKKQAFRRCKVPFYQKNLAKEATLYCKVACHVVGLQHQFNQSNFSVAEIAGLFGGWMLPGRIVFE